MSNELEAFLEYITIIRALSKKSIEAYRNDLLLIEESLQKPLISLNTQQILKLLSSYENKRTLNRKKHLPMIVFCLVYACFHMKTTVLRSVVY